MNKLARILGRTILIYDARRSPTAIHRADGDDPRTIRLVWDKDYGINGVFN